MIKIQYCWKFISFFLYIIISITFLSLILSFNIVKISYGQTTVLEQESETTITSYLDALIKAPLLISQALVVGVAFVYSFLYIRIIKKESIFFNNSKNFSLFALFNDKLFVIITVVCGAIILNMSTISVVYQASLLSLDLGLDLWSTFMILLSSSVGNIFIVKLLTSSFIIALGILYYYISKRLEIKIKKLGQDKEQQQQNLTKQKFQLLKISLIFCISILILGSINIFSNSIQSHNAAVDFFPFIAISVDWIHFMMVSIWVGGLFYISLNLSRKFFIKEKALNVHYHESSITYPKYAIISLQFYLSTILRFSIIAVISLGIIFITGMYMGVLHLQQPSSLFNSTYGNILIVKLLVVFSMAILGGYHHFRIPLLFNQKTEKTEVNQLQKLTRFNKTLKIEYILGIGIIFISSFLTITSPPQHESRSMDMTITMNTSPGDLDTQKMTNIHIQDFDNSFSLIALLLSISITILVILFIKRGLKSLKLYNQSRQLK